MNHKGNRDDTTREKTAHQQEVSAQPETGTLARQPPPEKNNLTN
jgi:hypothetical protein